MDVRGHDSTANKSIVIPRNISIIDPPVNFQSLIISFDELSRKPKPIQEFYKRQNEMIERFMEVDQVIQDLHQQPMNDVSYEEATQTDLEESSSLLSHHTQKQSNVWMIHLAINLSFIINIVLFISKLLVAILSGSMAILASAFESFLDIFSNAIIFFAAHVIRQKNIYSYPVGKSRMEPLGIIIFAVVITTSFIQVLIVSVQKLIQQEKPMVDLSPWAIVLLAANVVIKGMLAAWCFSIKGSSSVQVLAQDHYNDVLFNITSAIFPVISVWLNLAWIDPVGGIVLSLYIIYEWVSILLENVRRLSGQVASIDDIKQLTYMAYRFSSQIVAVETVRAYYVGDRLMVEIDIVLPPEMNLRQAHDLGESLQFALEGLDNVERAFVHLDYDTIHEFEHCHHRVVIPPPPPPALKE